MKKRTKRRYFDLFPCDFNEEAINELIQWMVCIIETTKCELDFVHPVMSIPLNAFSGFVLGFKGKSDFYVTIEMVYAYNYRVICHNNANRTVQVTWKNAVKVIDQQGGF